MPDTELQIQEQIIQLINPDLSPEASLTIFIDKLGEYINYLIQNNFQQLPVCYYFFSNEVKQDLPRWQKIH